MRIKCWTPTLSPKKAIFSFDVIFWFSIIWHWCTEVFTFHKLIEIHYIFFLYFNLNWVLISQPLYPLILFLPLICLSRDSVTFIIMWQQSFLFKRSDFTQNLQNVILKNFVLFFKYFHALYFIKSLYLLKFSRKS